VRRWGSGDGADHRAAGLNGALMTTGAGAARFSVPAPLTQRCEVVIDSCPSSFISV
jgi:hypothetical protein